MYIVTVVPQLLNSQPCVVYFTDDVEIVDKRGIDMSVVCLSLDDNYVSLLSKIQKTNCWKCGVAMI